MPVEIIIIVSIIIFITVIIEIFIELIMRKIFSHRGDGCLRFSYPMPSDFPHLSKQKFSVKSHKNVINGIIYKDINQSSYKKIIILSHGLGAGHEYLLFLINRLCLDGFIVVSYDQIGSMRSTGLRVKDLTQSLGDFEKVYKYIINDKQYKQYDIVVMGHSWGAYTSLNSLNIKNNRIKKCVAFAGFNNQTMLICGFAKFLCFFYPFLFLNDLIHHGKYALCSSVQGLKKTNAEVMCIHGDKDIVVNLKNSYELYKKVANKKKNIHPVLYENKGHHPFITYESEQLQNKLSNGLGLLGENEPAYDLKNNYFETYILDEQVINDVLKFLND